MPAMSISDLAGCSLVYLATPYSKYPEGHAAANVMACRIAARMMDKGVAVYSPIAHGYGIALHAREDGIDLSDGADSWTSVNHAVLTSCDALVVADVEGWQDSAGIRREVDMADWAMPIYLMDKDGGLSPLAHHIDWLDQEDGA